jgi:hypothetical protein
MSDLNVSAKFKLPDRFIEAHSVELLTWARDLQRYGPLLKVKLKRVPGVPNGVPWLPVDVTLECALYKQETDGSKLFVIRPHQPSDTWWIYCYCDHLPEIEKARAAFLEIRRRAQEPVDAVFENVAEAFVRAYRAELAAWGRNFGKSGGGTTIVLRSVRGAEVKLDEWGQPPMLGVELVARVEKRRDGRLRLLISPADEQSERLIALHAEEIVKLGEPEARRVN